MIRLELRGAGIVGAVLLLAALAAQGAFAQGIRGSVRGYYGAAKTPENAEENVKVDLFVDGRLVRTTYTDAAGAYAIDGVPEGFVELVHSRPGLATVTVAAGRYRYPHEYLVEVLMHPALGSGGSFDLAVRLVLTFLDADSGEPLAGRKIELQGWGELETDALGRFMIKGYPRGTQVLEFRSEGYEPQVLRERIQGVYNRLVVRLQREQ